jgi:hypothetical protein
LWLCFLERHWLKEVEELLRTSPALQPSHLDACDLALEALEYVGEQFSNETSPGSIALEEYFSQPKDVLVSLYPIMPEWVAYQGKQSFKASSL